MKPTRKKPRRTYGTQWMLAMEAKLHAQNLS